MGSSTPVPDKKQSLLHQGFKVVYVPDAADDELKVIFKKVVAGLKMTVSNSVPPSKSIRSGHRF